MRSSSLSALLRSRRVDSYLSQALEVVLTLIRINHVNRLVAALESIFYEWEQDPILFVGAVEESADMTRFVELGTSKGNGSGRFLHRISPTGYRAAPQLNPLNKDAPLCPQMSNRYFGIDRYVRPIDSSSRLWLNETAAERSNHEHCVGIGDVNEQRTSRTEEL